MPAVAKLMNLPVKICHAYYLGVYKNSNEYRLLKAVGKEEREIKEEEQGTFLSLFISSCRELLFLLNCLFFISGMYSRHLLCVWRRRKIDYLRRL